MSRPLFTLNGLTKLYQGAIVWKHLKHPNTVPFFGVSGTPFQLGSSWMSGRVSEEAPSAWSGVSPSCCAGSTLHSRPIVHGDLKEVRRFLRSLTQPLINDSAKYSRRRCRLTHFGLATVSPYPGSTVTIPNRKCYPLRWTAPGVLRGGIGISKEQTSIRLAW